MRLTLIALLLAGVVGCDAKYESHMSYNRKESKEVREDAEKGIAEAQYELASRYDSLNSGLDSDKLEAVKWYRKAAEQGHVGAQYNLGVMYANGEGVPEDYAEAVKWVRKAAEQGIADAKFMLGVMYARGDGVPEDFVEAYAWLSVAATNGDGNAKKGLPELKAKLTPEQLTAAEKRAAELTKQLNANKAK